MHLLLGTIFSVAAIYSVVAWARDLMFYSRMDWDFSVPSGRRISSGTGAHELTNSQRVKFGYPFAIVAFGTGGFVLLFLIH